MSRNTQPTGYIYVLWWPSRKKAGVVRLVRHLVVGELLTIDGQEVRVTFVERNPQQATVELVHDSAERTA